MQLTDYSIEKLKTLKLCVECTMQTILVAGPMDSEIGYYATISDCIEIRTDIEQAIKDLEFEQQRNNLPFE